MPPSDRRPSGQRANKDPIASELGAAQAEIMNVIWDTEGATVPEIHAAINKKRKTGAAYTTVINDRATAVRPRSAHAPSQRDGRSATAPRRAGTSSSPHGPTR